MNTKAPPGTTGRGFCCRTHAHRQWRRDAHREWRGTICPGRVPGRRAPRAGRERAGRRGRVTPAACETRISGRGRLSARAPPRLGKSGPGCAGACGVRAALWRWWWHTDAMTPWRIRDFHADDLDAAVRLWDNPAASSDAPAFSLSDLIAAVRSHEPAVVAVAGEELVGTAVATVSGDRAWVMRISLAAAWRRRGIGSAMLGELERRLVAAGVHRIRCLLGGGSEIGALALEHAGYTARRGWFLRRLEPVEPGSAACWAARRPGGRAGPGSSSAAWPGRRS